MQMLEPLFKFVLQDPKVSDDRLVRQQLHTSLLQAASTLVRRLPGIRQNTCIIIIIIIFFLPHNKLQIE